MAEDIISTLPDAILCHILSFLETTYAVATSILSKRWKHLWHSVPTLYFNTQVTYQNSNYDFNDFVYSVLVTRDATLPIKSFHLHVTYFKVLNEYFHHPVNVITKWVNFVVQRKVEYLNLHVEYLDSAGLAKIPTSILTCTTLVVLKLFCFSVEEGYSSSVVLPYLKTLHLESMIFSKLPDLMMFLNGCPNLEDLLTFDVVFDSEESLTCEDWKSFCLSSLTRADIDCTYSYFPLKAVHNVPSLRFEINQVNYCNLIPTFHNLTQLEFISLDYSWRFLIEVLSQCPKLQKLHLDQADTEKKTWTRKDEKENWVDPDVVPQCLSLHLRTCDLFNFLGLQGELLLAEYILKNAKVLQIMRIRNVGQTKIKRLISSCPKASTTCKITIIKDSIKQVEKLYDMP